MTGLDIAGRGMTSQRTRNRLIQRLTDKGIADTRVLKVMAVAPRHLFMDEAMSSHAYEDMALPIGHGQTISHPYAVARMTELLLEKGVPAKVLEVGTGSGYQGYILSKLIGKVFSVERIDALYRQARALFVDLGVRNIQVKYTHGAWGWVENGPYPAIMVTAAPPEIPQALLEQLAPGGRMVIPVGDGDIQELKVVDYTENGLETTVVEMVRFVPLLDGAT